MITIVDPIGSYFKVIRKNDLNQAELKLDSMVAGNDMSSSTSILGGSFSDEFVTVFLQSNGE